MTSELGLREGPEQELSKNAYYLQYRILVTYLQGPKFSGYKTISFRSVSYYNSGIFFFKLDFIEPMPLYTRGLSTPSA